MPEVVGLVTTPSGAHHVVACRNGSLNVYLTPYPCAHPLGVTQEEIDGWLAEQFRAGTEFVTQSSELPFVVVARGQTVKVGGLDRFKLSICGMVQEPWTSVIRALAQSFQGKVTPLPAGHKFNAAFKLDAQGICAA